MELSDQITEPAPSITDALGACSPPTFLAAVQSELARARFKHAKINSAHEGYAVILEELDEFKAQCWLKRELRNHREMLAELVQVAAMAARTAEDLGLC